MSELRWHRIKSGGTSSHDGQWRIVPVPHETRKKVDGYELWRWGEVVATKATIRACKLHALEIAQKESCKGHGYRVHTLDASASRWRRSN